MKLLKTLLKTATLILIISQFSCRKDFSTTTSNGNLTFSKDTLVLDTVFNDLSTTTHLLKVYNKSNNDITIPKIELERSNSKYRINIDGIVGSEFEDVLLLKKDSLFVFVEATIAAEDSNDEMLYEDKLLFDPNGTKQHVNLITLVKDAHFIFSDTEEDIIIKQKTFTNEKPYVIYGNAVVSKENNLTIEAGSTVFFSENSSLTVAEDASLKVEGTLNDSIVFRGDQLSYNFDQIPGQWQGISVEKNATITADYLKILNPTVGLKIVDNANTTTLNNSEIYNAAAYGIYTQNANLNASNLVIGQARKSGLFLQGGTYNFNHCTFANYWNKSIRSNNNVTLANYYIDSEGVEIDIPLVEANFSNSIISGTRQNEISFDKSETNEIFNFNFKNCLIDLKKGEDFLNTENNEFYTNSLFNKTYDFRDTSTNDLRIGLENEGINKADKTSASLFSKDIIGTDRTNTPDIGAYQHIDFETLEPEEEATNE